MADATDLTFYDRADAHIELSNQQLQAHENLGQVSASMMFGTTRFNAGPVRATSSPARKWPMHGRRC